ncbi:dna repair protein rad7 [Diplodia corticola]|uniref:Dna repair protein rad7 n=1 Tax=Diplodia corticola TaxID=236234 RepID=A0A1J9R3E1_9PEZI|nr:dna repair protein rad7 [Diplodia corticola]OJD35950.1 dna repair protein rad7 [Diplodia corticola]
MGGYYRNSDVTDPSLRNTPLPEKIRCSTCNKWKGQTNFARKRLNELRERIRDDRHPFTTQCTLCTPQQVMELKCKMCAKVKGLDEFSKAQRKNPDHAKCNPCMKEQLELEAIEDKLTYHGEVITNSDSDDDDDDDSDPEHYFDDADSNYAQSGTGTATGNLIGDFDDLSLSDSRSTTTGGFWTPPHDRPAAGGSKASGSGSGTGARAMSYAASVSSTSTVKKDGSSTWGSSFNPMGYGHPRSSSVADSMETNRPGSSKNSGWAKIKAFKAEQEPEPKDKDEDEDECPWGEAEEEDSSSDEDDSDDEYKSNRRANGNRIRGPNSALTDFLAANNISAAEIRDNYERRRQQATVHAENSASQTPDATSSSNNDAQPEEAEAGPAAPATRKRKAGEITAEAKNLAKIKKSKAFQKKKAQRKAEAGDSDSDYDDALARDMYKKVQPPPGQLENCEICNKRFTVTSYSKTGPDGGLVCTPCGKELAAEAGPSKKQKKPVGQTRRRKLESDRMDATYKPQGAKTLEQLCIEKVAKHHSDIDEFGDLPENVLDRIAEIFSKKRVLNPRTLKLFLRSDLDSVAVHDAAYLETEDYTELFANAPHLKKVVLRNATQFKDENVEYMLDKCKDVQYLQLYAANLVTDEMWHQLFMRHGSKLQDLKLQWLDAAFDDDVVDTLVANAPNLVRLKLKLCRRITSRSIDLIAELKHLRHLSLQTSAEVPSERVVDLVGCVGAELETLSLEHFLDANDDVLDAIHSQCRNLRKFRFSENDYCSDAAFADLFTDWANPPLHIAHLNSTRDVDNQNPKGPEQAIGLASDGIQALMKHSGQKLRSLNIASCRHISHEAFMNVFDGQKIYPELKTIDISFCNHVDTVVVAGIFKSCPKLERLVSFGNFNVEGVVVPKGVVLIGVPKALDSIEQAGIAEFDMALAASLMEPLEQASNMMVGVGA